MGQKTGIAWCHHTFNPWRGCTAISPGCANCYAAQWSKRNPKVLGTWGADGTRPVASAAYFREPLKWNAQVPAGERRRVFCASLADFFEAPDTMPAEALAGVRAARLKTFDLIRATPNLDWLLVTKRPENIRNVLKESRRLADENLAWWLEDWRMDFPVPANVWIGASVENQKTADERIPHLLAAPAALRFLSIEPLLEPVTLRRMTGDEEESDWLRGFIHATTQHVATPSRQTERVEWVIIGGESQQGPRPARPCDLAWIRKLVKECRAADVPVFVKQLGSEPSDILTQSPIPLKDRAGADPAEWPPDLQIQEVRTASSV